MRSIAEDLASDPAMKRLADLHLKSTIKQIEILNSFFEPSFFAPGVDMSIFMSPIDREEGPRYSRLPRMLPSVFTIDPWWWGSGWFQSGSKPWFQS